MKNGVPSLIKGRHEFSRKAISRQPFQCLVHQKLNPPLIMHTHIVPYQSASSPDWSAITPLRAFGLPWEERPPPETEFRAAWNEQFFRFRFDCVDEDLVLAERPTPEECVLDSDRVEIFLTPDLSLSTYYCLEIDPLGNLLDYKAHHYRKFDRTWKFLGVEIHAQISAHRYSVTGSLPISELRELEILRPGSSQLYAGVHRAEFSHRIDGSIQPGWMTWVAPGTERPDFHVASAFGILELQTSSNPSS